METLDLNKIAQQAHANAVEHGFWEERRSNEHYMMLVITEVVECVEAHRKNNWACDKPDYDLYVEGHKTPFITFNGSIKNTVEDEMADIVIRLADLAGALGIDFDKLMPTRYVREFDRFSFTENAYALTRGLTRDTKPIEKRIQWGMSYVQMWAEHHLINLAWHIREKMAHNALREPKHGKLY